MGGGCLEVEKRGSHKATLGSEPVLSQCGGEGKSKGTGRRECLECRESMSCVAGSGAWRHA